MKKFAIGFVAMVVAIGTFSFTNHKSTRFACSDSDLVWFEVLPGQGLNNVSIGGTIALNRLDLTNYVDLGTPIPDGVVTAADFPTSGSNDRIHTQATATTLFGCPATQFLCYVAFNASTLTNFEIDASGNVVPKKNLSGVSIPQVACIIYRSQQ